MSRTAHAALRGVLVAGFVLFITLDRKSVV